MKFGNAQLGDLNTVRENEVRCHSVQMKAKRLLFKCVSLMLFDILDVERVGRY
jgi:hypothetical protein